MWRRQEPTSSQLAAHACQTPLCAHTRARARRAQDLEQWRRYNGRSMDFTLLERNGGAGWDLAQKLLAKRNDFYRGRIGVKEALRHRFFLPELF
jgi:hypothetical protein